MVEKVTCHTEEEKTAYEKEGYVVVSVSYFTENSAPTYTMERGSDWSQKLENK